MVYSGPEASVPNVDDEQGSALRAALSRLRSELTWRTAKKVKVLGGIDTQDMQGLVQHLDAMIAVNRRAVAALTQIADETSPLDGSGEPLQVRIAKDLTRRIEIAQLALAMTGNVSAPSVGMTRSGMNPESPAPTPPRSPQ